MNILYVNSVRDALCNEFPGRTIYVHYEAVRHVFKWDAQEDMGRWSVTVFEKGARNHLPNVVVQETGEDIHAVLAEIRAALKAPACADDPLTAAADAIDGIRADIRGILAPRAEESDEDNPSVQDTGW